MFLLETCAEAQKELAIFFSSHCNQSLCGNPEVVSLERRRTGQLDSPFVQAFGGQVPVLTSLLTGSVTLDFLFHLSVKQETEVGSVRFQNHKEWSHSPESSSHIVQMHTFCKVNQKAYSL